MKKIESRQILAQKGLAVKIPLCGILLMTLGLALVSTSCDEGRARNTDYYQYPTDDTYPKDVTITVKTFSSGFDQVYWGDALYTTLADFQEVWIRQDIYNEERILIRIVHLDSAGNYVWTSDEMEFNNQLPGYNIDIYDDQVVNY